MRRAKKREANVMLDARYNHDRSIPNSRRNHMRLRITVDVSKIMNLGATSNTALEFAVILGPNTPSPIKWWMSSTGYSHQPLKEAARSFRK